MTADREQGAMGPPPLTASGRPRQRARWGWGGLQQLEGLFNPLGQQRGGFLWALLRANGGRDRSDPLISCLSQGAFNTNPPLAGYLLGSLSVRLNAPAAAQSEGMEATVDRTKNVLAPLLSGIGDRIFYGGVRPALSLLGIFLALGGFGDPAVCYWVGYNSIQLYWRHRSWSVGLRGEGAVRQELQSRILERWAGRTAQVARLLLGLTLGIALGGLWISSGALWSAVLLVLCLIGYGLQRSGRIRPLTLGWIGVGLAGLIALLRVLLERGAA